MAPKSRKKLDPIEVAERAALGVDVHIVYIREDIDELKESVQAMRKEAREDFRILFGALVTASLGLAALMAHGFKWI